MEDKMENTTEEATNLSITETSKLSADVEPFVPRHYHQPLSVSASCESFMYPGSTPDQQSIQLMPSYITNCYPFVSEDYASGYDANQWGPYYSPLNSPQFTGYQMADMNAQFSPQSYTGDGNNSGGGNRRCNSSRGGHQGGRFRQNYSSQGAGGHRESNYGKPNKRMHHESMRAPASARTSDNYGRLPPDQQQQSRNWSSSSSSFNQYYHSAADQQYESSEASYSAPTSARSTGSRRGNRSSRDRFRDPDQPLQQQISQEPRREISESQSIGITAGKDEYNPPNSIRPKTAPAGFGSGNSQQQQQQQPPSADQSQAYNSRHHNRTLGDFLPNIKQSSKNRGNWKAQSSSGGGGSPAPTWSSGRGNDGGIQSTPSDWQHPGRRQQQQQQQSVRSSPHNYFSPGFHIHKSDWPKTGVQQDGGGEQDNHRTLSEVLFKKPKSFADIIKSSPPKLSQVQTEPEVGVVVDSKSQQSLRDSRHQFRDSAGQFKDSGRRLRDSQQQYRDSQQHQFREAKCGTKCVDAKVDLCQQMSRLSTGGSRSVKVPSLSLPGDENNRGRRVFNSSTTKCSGNNDGSGCSFLDRQKSSNNSNNKHSAMPSADVDGASQWNCGNLPPQSGCTNGRGCGTPPPTEVDGGTSSLFSRVRNYRHKVNSSASFENEFTPNLSGEASLGKVDFVPSRVVPSEKHQYRQKYQQGMAETMLTTTATKEKKAKKKKNNSGLNKKNNLELIQGKMVFLSHETFTKFSAAAASANNNNKVVSVGKQQQQQSKQSSCRSGASVKTSLNDVNEYPELGYPVFVKSKKYGRHPKNSARSEEDPDWSDIESDGDLMMDSTRVSAPTSVRDSAATTSVTSSASTSTTAFAGTMTLAGKVEHGSSQARPPFEGMSYSAALKHHGVEVPNFSSESSKSKTAAVMADDALTFGVRKYKKKQKRKNRNSAFADDDAGNSQVPPVVLTAAAANTTSAQQQEQRKRVKPKSNALIELDIAQILTATQAKKKSPKKQRVRFPVSSGRLLYGRDSKTNKVVANILDSTAPPRRRGKERETPAKKHYSALKKIILKEREERRKRREKQERHKRLISTGSLSDNDGNATDSAWETQGSLSSAATSLIDGEEGEGGGGCGFGFSGAGTSRSGVSTASSAAKSLIHSRRFREYCNHMLKKEIDQSVTVLIQDLIRFHTRLFHRDPLKAKSRRRIVLGLREVTKHLKLRKLKCVILAPNLDRIRSKGGLDDTIGNIMRMADDQNVPCLFALSRKLLGRVCYKQVPVSCVGVFNYSGSEKNYQHLMELLYQAQDEYNETLSGLEEVDGERHETTKTLTTNNNNNSSPVDRRNN